MTKGMDLKCPRTDPTVKSAPELHPCPKCGEELEIWTDEKSATCPSCNAKVTREEIEKGS